MPDVGGALSWAEVFEESADLAPSRFDSSLIGFADEAFELCEHHFDWIEIGTVGRQKEEMGLRLAYCLADSGTFVAPQVIENDDVARSECRHQRLLDPGQEDGAVDGTIQNEWCHDLVVAQAGQERQGLPMAVGDLGKAGLAARAPAVGTGHVGLDPGLVEEDQAARVNLVLMSLPAFPEPGQLRSSLLLGQQRFF